MQPSKAVIRMRRFRKTTVNVLAEVVSIAASFLAMAAPLGLPLVPITILGFSLFTLLTDVKIHPYVAGVAAAITAICFEGIGLIAARSKELHLDYQRNRLKSDVKLDVEAVLKNPWIYAFIGSGITLLVGLLHTDWQTQDNGYLATELVKIALESSIFFVIVFANRVVTQFESVVHWQDATEDRRLQQAAKADLTRQVKTLREELAQLNQTIVDQQATLDQLRAQETQSAKDAGSNGGQSGTISPLNGVSLAQANQHKQAKIARRREQVLTLKQQQLTNQEIANQLKVSLGTVKNDVRLMNGRAK